MRSPPGRPPFFIDFPLSGCYDGLLHVPGGRTARGLKRPGARKGRNTMNRRRIVSTIVVGVLALGAIVLGGWQARADSNAAPSAAPHYLPPGGEVGKGEQFAAMDTYWNDRLTYPTGHFNPAWLRAAKRQDARIASRTPGHAPDLGTWTALGPQPERMTGCTNCYDYG